MGCTMHECSPEQVGVTELGLAESRAEHPGGAAEGSKLSGTWGGQAGLVKTEQLPVPEAREGTQGH